MTDDSEGLRYRLEVTPIFVPRVLHHILGVVVVIVFHTFHFLQMCHIIYIYIFESIKSSEENHNVVPPGAEARQIQYRRLCNISCVRPPCENPTFSYDPTQ